jgi:hypothetical protein
MARLAAGATDVVTVELLFAATGSVVPVGTATVAVLTIEPVADAVPVTVTVTLLPALAAMFAVRPTALPVPEAAPHAAVPAATQVHVTDVRFGTVSAIVAPVTLLGPLFVATNVYVTVVPCAAVAGPVLVIARSAAGVIVVMTADVLFAVAGSVVPDGGATDAVFVTEPVAAAVPVTVIVSALPAPAFNCTADSAITFPVPDAVPQAAVPDETQDHDTPVRLAGTVSAIDAPDTFDGPPFVATNVYDIVVP